MAPTPLTYSDWAILPKQLLDKILDDHLVHMADCIRFSVVCKDWYCVASDNFKDVGGKNQRPHQRKLPFLMVSTPDSSTDSRCLYDVTRKSVYEFQLKVPNNVSGCSHGWLITVADDSFQVTLFNPFSGKSIHLPPLRRLLYEKRHSDELQYLSAVPRRQMFEYDKRMRKEYEEEDIGEEEFDQAFDAPRSHQSNYSIAMGALSADPDVDMNGYALMVIYGLDSRLAFIKSGDENWTYIDREPCDFYETIYPDPIPHSGSRLTCLEDLICRPNGIFYVLAYNGVVFSIDFHGGKQKIKLIAVEDEKEMSPFRSKAYLVESPEGDIFRIIRGDKYMMGAERLTIQKLVESSDSSSQPQQWRWRWRKVETIVDRKVETIVDSLRDVSLFLGRNHAICITASDFSGCQPNSIFFWDDDFWYYYRHGGPKDIGLCHLHGGGITRHGPPYYCHWQVPTPIWILPKFVFPTINICLAS